MIRGRYQPLVPAEAGTQSFFRNSVLPGSRIRGNERASMPEMPRAGDDHGDAVLVGGFDDLIVAH